MDNKLKSIETCKGCGIEYDRNNVGRIYGYESSVFAGGYHSAACYTEAMTQKASTDNKLLCTEGFKTFAIGLESDEEKMQIINEHGQHVAYVEIDPCKEVAERVVNAWNCHDELYNALLEAKNTILQMGTYIRQMDEDCQCLEYWNQDGDYLSIPEWEQIKNALQKANPNYKP